MTSVHATTDGPKTEECKLLSGGFASLLQVLLGLIAISVLVLKRYNEVPQRPLTIWAFDASKQLVGAGFAHVVNLLIAILLYEHTSHGPGAELAATAAVGVDQCAFYFVNFTMDTTVGVVLNWVFLEMSTSMAMRCHWHALMTPGDYGTPPELSIWLKQLLAWIGVIFAAKMVIALVILVCVNPLAAAARWLFAPLQPYPHVELALVMIACPCLMNALQFWVQDSFLKKDARADHVRAATRSPAEKGLRIHREKKEESDDRTPEKLPRPSKSPRFVIEDEEDREDTLDQEEGEDNDTASDSSRSTATSTSSKRRTVGTVADMV